MRALLKIALCLVGSFALTLLAAFSWFCFYSRDLPDITIIGQFAPPVVNEAFEPCVGRSMAIPYEALGANLRNAITAVETSESDPSVLQTLLISRWHSDYPLSYHPRTLNASIYIARTLCYKPSRQSIRTLAELRTAVQLERRYSRRQLFTAFANRAYFGPNLIGVYQASAFYFQKAPVELSISEAALLIALIYSPTMYSPLRHPDRSLSRRNQIIDTMEADGSITAAEGQAAKAAPLQAVPFSD